MKTGSWLKSTLTMGLAFSMVFGLVPAVRAQETPEKKSIHTSLCKMWAKWLMGEVSLLIMLKIHSIWCLRTKQKPLRISS